MIRALAAVALAALATLSGAQDKPKEGARELKLSTALGPAYPQGRAGEVWARLISERSAGRIAVRHAPGAMLVQRDPAREFAALRAGAIDLAVGSTLVWSAQVKELNLIALPWLVPDAPALAALLGGDVGARLLAHVEAAGVVALELAANGFVELATNAPVHAPRDLDGLRIRLQPASPLLTDTLMALGASPAAMAYADAQAALSSGTLAGQETSVAAYAASRQYAAGLKYLQLWGAHADALVFAVNQAAWQSLSDDDRQLVRQAARDAAKQAIALGRKLHEPAALARLGSDGAVVTRLTAAGKQMFKNSVQATYRRWAEIIGADLVRSAEAVVAAPGI